MQGFRSSIRGFFLSLALGSSVVNGAPSEKEEKLPIQQLFENGLEIGDGTWKFKDSRIEVYSWSYGFPALLVFGDLVESGTLQATMKNAGSASNGFQGLVICMTKQIKQDDGYHGSAAYFVRYSRGMVELLDSIPYHKNLTPPRQLASAPAEIKNGSEYKLRIAVSERNVITVWINDAKALEYSAQNKLSGKYALLAANGSYVFTEVSN